MRIEHVVYLTLEEWYDLIKESGAQSKLELMSERMDKRGRSCRRYYVSAP